jgi:transcriptional regulator with XRE-family HTH domain
LVTFTRETPIGPKRSGKTFLVIDHFSGLIKMRNTMPSSAPAPSEASSAVLAVIAGRIREHRKALAVSAMTTAEAAGMSRVTLHRIECGEPSVTMGAYLNAMTALGMEIDILSPSQIEGHDRGRNGMSPPGRHRPQTDGLRQATDSLQGLPVSGLSLKGEYRSAPHQATPMSAEPGDNTLPLHIRLADHAQLRRLAWHIPEALELTPEEALGLYERNWRHVDVQNMDATERALLDKLVKVLGKGRLLV